MGIEGLELGRLEKTACRKERNPDELGILKKSRNPENKKDVKKQPKQKSRRDTRLDFMNECLNDLKEVLKYLTEKQLFNEKFRPRCETECGLRKLCLPYYFLYHPDTTFKEVEEYK